MTSETIEHLFNLPVDFHQIKTMSVVDLISRRGYMSAVSLPNRVDIAAYLGTKPELIDAWQAYSDDQRVDRGWVLRQSTSGFSVYQHPVGQVLHFTDKCDASAEFILRYIASVTR